MKKHTGVTSLKDIIRIAVLGWALAGIPVQAGLVVSEGFGGSDGTGLDGRTPDGFNLPGRTWQRNGGASGRSDIQGATMNVRCMDGLAYPIASSGTYIKSPVMTLQVDLRVGTLNRMGVGVGFTASPGTANSTLAFIGLTVDQNGTLKEWNGVPGDPQTPIGQVAWAGSGGAAFTADSWHTLTYTVNLLTGMLSNISLSGSTADYTPLQVIVNAGLTDAATGYLAVAADSLTGVGNGNIDNLQLAAEPTPLPDVTLSVAGSPMAEAGGVAAIIATLSTPYTDAVTVNLAFSGTATVDSDYTRTGTSIVIPAGNLSNGVVLRAIPDTVYKRKDETIVVDIVSVIHATANLAQRLMATITEDDPVPPFPVTAGQRGTVTCLDYPAITYDIYLPAGYSAQGTPLPILYTFNPSGGGMVGDFRNVCSTLKIIVVGVTGVANGVGWDPICREMYAVTRDVRQRVVFDPTAEMASGVSGGGWASYYFSRFRPQHVAGVYAMGSWMGVLSPGSYSILDWVPCNMLVARSTGTTDTNAKAYLTADKNFLLSCGAPVTDWDFTGGHVVSPDAQKTSALTWILNTRTLAGTNDRATAETQAANWRGRIQAGTRQDVLREAVDTLASHPRSWFAYQAQAILDELMNDPKFLTQDVTDLGLGDMLNNFFYFTARGAALTGDMQTYQSAMRALTGISGVYGDRSGGYYALLSQFGFAPPVGNLSHDAQSLNLSFIKTTPGLSHTLETSLSLADGSWQKTACPTSETSTTWSASPAIVPEVKAAFYRIRSTPTPSTSPVDPGQ